MQGALSTAVEGRSATRSLAGRSGAGLSAGGLVRAVQNTQAMPDALKNIAVDIAGAAGAASAAINNLHGVLRLLARHLTDVSIVSVGGVTTGQDVLDRLEAGASLVQGYTAFLYEGPLWAGRINAVLERH